MIEDIGGNEELWDPRIKKYMIHGEKFVDELSIMYHGPRNYITQFVLIVNGQEYLHFHTPEAFTCTTLGESIQYKLKPSVIPDGIYIPYDRSIFITVKFKKEGGASHLSISTKDVSSKPPSFRFVQDQKQFFILTG
jgi:hypothetical protein